MYVICMGVLNIDMNSSAEQQRLQNYMFYSGFLINDAKKSLALVYTLREVLYCTLLRIEHAECNHT